MKSFGCMPAVRTPEASRTLTVSCPGILPSPLRDKVGAFHHDRFRGYVSVHFRSGLPPPCLRFAVAVAGHHARLGTRLLVRLCRGRHHRRLNSMRLQGATLTRSERCRKPTSGLSRRDVFELAGREANQKATVAIQWTVLRPHHAKGGRPFLQVLWTNAWIKDTMVSGASS